MQDPAYNIEEMSIGDKLKELRQSKGLTQSKAAEVCGVGLRTYIDWENGVNSKPLAAFDKIREMN